VSFPDEKLKQLKERNPLQMRGVEIMHLLSRLKAAEMLIGIPDPLNVIWKPLFKDWLDKSGKWTPSYFDGSQDDLKRWKAWRKAAGK